MSTGPELSEGEEILYHHKPDLDAFRGFALRMIAITLLPTVMFVYAFPDSIAVVLPLLFTCMILLQDRLSLGKHAAWVTTKRIVLQNGRSLDLAKVGRISGMRAEVRIVPAEGGKGAQILCIYYVKDRKALTETITAAHRALQ